MFGFAYVGNGLRKQSPTYAGPADFKYVRVYQSINRGGMKSPGETPGSGKKKAIGLHWMEVCGTAPKASVFDSIYLDLCAGENLDGKNVFSMVWHTFEDRGRVRVGCTFVRGG